MAEKEGEEERADSKTKEHTPAYFQKRVTTQPPNS